MCVTKTTRMRIRRRNRVGIRIGVINRIRRRFIRGCTIRMWRCVIIRIMRITARVTLIFLSLM